MRPYIVVVLLLVAACVATSASDRNRQQFKRWYPQFGYVFDRILHEQCYKEYDSYLYGVDSNTTIQLDTGADDHTRYTQPVINCLLNNTSQYILYQLSSSQVILGLTPTILAILGASSDETALLVVIGKRPILAFMLALASPSVFTSRAFDYRNPREILKDRDGRYRVTIRPGWRRVIIVAEYIFGFAALANLATINWDLGTQTVCTIATELNFLPAIWSILGIGVHGVGVILLRMRARRTEEPCQQAERHTMKAWRSRLRRESKLALPYEFRYGPGREPQKIYTEWSAETKPYICLSWSHSIFTVAHIIFGTLVFSGMNFVGPRDAMQVLGRYMGSILGCRIVLMYELSVIRSFYNEGLRDEATAGDCKKLCQHRTECYRCGGTKSNQVDSTRSETTINEVDRVSVTAETKPQV